MEKRKDMKPEELEKVNGGYRIDDDGNKYYMGFGIDSAACVGCGNCARVCPMQCIQIVNQVAEINTDVCIECLACTQECPTNALGDYRKIIVR